MAIEGITKMLSSGMSIRKIAAAYSFGQEKISKMLKQNPASGDNRS